MQNDPSIPATEEAPLPRRVVAIVGRPNVGKSSLFNRLAGRRIAIVHEQAGVTRDRLAAEVSWGHQRFEVIDTGGIGLMDGEHVDDLIEAGIVEQAQVAIQDARVVIMVVDVTTGVMPLDVEVARQIRDRGRPVFLAANKADGVEQEALAADFGKLGFPVFPCSATHNRGVDPLMDEVLAELPPAENPTEENPLRVAFVGRPNAGKSSFINRFIRHKRVIVSEVPGTTRDSIEVPFKVGSGPQARNYTLIDTAGVRRPGKVKDLVEKFSMQRTEKSIERADLVVLVMDATEGPKVRDKKLANHIMEHHKGCVILVNKWDLAEDTTTQRQYGKALMQALPWLSFAPVIFASAKTGFNVRKSIEAIDYVAKQIDTEMSTGVLNRVLKEAMQKIAPPRVKGDRLKVYYVTQTGTRPVRVKLFCNHPKRVSPQYRQYLIRSLREKFGLEGAPVALNFSARPKPQLDEKFNRPTGKIEHRHPTWKQAELDEDDDEDEFFG